MDKNVPPRNLISPKIHQAEKTSRTLRTLREFKISLYGVKSIIQSFLKLPPLLYKCGGKCGDPYSANMLEYSFVDKVKVMINVKICFQ